MKINQFILWLIGIGALLYFNSLLGVFLWDDYAQVVNNYLVHSITNIPRLFAGSTFIPINTLNGVGGYYKPFMAIAYAIIYSGFGLNPFFFHLIQVSIHILNAVLLFILLRYVFRKKIAFGLSLLFLIHPMNSEVVAYIASLQEVLFMVFGLSALLLLREEKLSIRRLFLVGVLLLCSLLSKETGALFLLIIPLFLFLIERIVKRREYMPVGLMMASVVSIYSFLRFFIAKVYFQTTPDVPAMTASITQRFFSMPEIFFSYIKTFIFPKTLYVDQFWFYTSPTNNFYVPLVLDILFLVAVLIVAIWIYCTQKKLFPVFLFFAIWFFIGIGFHLQIVPLDMTYSDRWFYFPMIGLLGMIGAGISNISIKASGLKAVVLIVFVVIVSSFFLRTLIRNTNFSDGVTLFSHDIVAGGRTDRIEDLLAIELTRTGQYAEALKHLQNLLKNNPNQPALYSNIAVLDELTGDFQGAKDSYEKIISTDGTGMAAYNIARIMVFHDGNFSAARKITQEALISYPLNGNLWVVQAAADYNMGNKKEALVEAQKAHDLIPNNTTDSILTHIQNNEQL